MTTPATATDQPPEKKKKERKPRATSKYIVLNVLNRVRELKPEEANTLSDGLEILDLTLADFMGPGKRKLAIIEGDPHNGIIAAREYVESERVSGKRIMIACVRRDGSATPVNGVELKGL